MKPMVAIAGLAAPATLGAGCTNDSATIVPTATYTKATCRAKLRLLPPAPARHWLRLPALGYGGPYYGGPYYGGGGPGITFSANFPQGG